MLHKHYGKIIKADRPDLEQQASEDLKLDIEMDTSEVIEEPVETYHLPVSIAQNSPLVPLHLREK